MDIAFAEEKDKIMVIYLDDITVFSKSDEEHVAHLLRVFRKCRRFGMSLNPKKSHFTMKEGKLRGNIISQERHQDRPQAGRGHPKDRAPSK